MGLLRHYGLDIQMRQGKTFGYCVASFAGRGLSGKKLSVKVEIALEDREIGGHEPAVRKGSFRSRPAEA